MVERGPGAFWCRERNKTSYVTPSMGTPFLGCGERERRGGDLCPLLRPRKEKMTRPCTGVKWTLKFVQALSRVSDASCDPLHGVSDTFAAASPSPGDNEASISFFAADDCVVEERVWTESPPVPKSEADLHNNKGRTPVFAASSPVRPCHPEGSVEPSMFLAGCRSPSSSLLASLFSSRVLLPPSSPLAPRLRLVRLSRLKADEGEVLDGDRVWVLTKEGKRGKAMCCVRKGVLFFVSRREGDAAQPWVRYEKEEGGAETWESLGEAFLWRLRKRGAQEEIPPEIWSTHSFLVRRIPPPAYVLSAANSRLRSG